MTNETTTVYYCAFCGKYSLDNDNDLEQGCSEYQEEADFEGVVIQDGKVVLVDGLSLFQLRVLVGGYQ